MGILRYTICAVIVLAVATPSHAFNGKRKGFVLGGGLGVAPLARIEVGSYDESRVGVASNFLIGYGWDEQNLLVFEGNGTSYKPDAGPDAMFSQGFGGPAFYHYFKPAAPTFFTVAGVGFYSFWYDIEDGEEDSNDSGLGLMGGVGYEFSRHWQVSLVVNGGKTDGPSNDATHLNVEVLIGGVAF